MRPAAWQWQYKCTRVACADSDAVSQALVLLLRVPVPRALARNPSHVVVLVPGDPPLSQAVANLNLDQPKSPTRLSPRKSFHSRT
eukprot:341375-Rhodomonas_salina.2